MGVAEDEVIAVGTAVVVEVALVAEAAEDTEAAATEHHEEADTVVDTVDQEAVQDTGRTKSSVDEL